MTRHLRAVPWALLVICLLAGADTSPPAQRIHGVVANNVAVAGNPLVDGAVATAKGSAPATVTAGNVAQLFSDTEHRLFVNTVHPNTFSGSGSAISATTQVLGLSGSGLSYYITDIFFFNNVATAQTVNIVSSTTAGNACATSPATITPSVVFGAVANGFWVMSFQTPLKATANSALCCKASAATSFSCLVNGFIGP